MKTTAISVTEAARNFADCVNRAHYQNVTFVLLRNGSPVARLVPDEQKVCSGRDLARVLEKSQLLKRTKPKHGVVICELPAKPSNLRLINGDNS